jgi:hypothetical protein
MTDQFASQFPYTYPINGCFVVANIIHNSNKTIRIFDYPIPVGTTRDLLRIPGVSEASIRVSLLKGELRNKLIAGEIEVICSDIDLLQFNDIQKQFLLDGGVVKGLEVTGSGSLAYLRKEEIALIGLKNGINRTFFTPDKFLNGLVVTGDQFHIAVKHNGKDLYEGIDYTIGESSGAGTGYDTINLISIIPIQSSTLFANYAVSV